MMFCNTSNSTVASVAQNQWSFVGGLLLNCCVTKTSQPVASYTEF